MLRTPMLLLLLLAAGLFLALASPVVAQDKEPEIFTRLKKAKVEGPFTLVVLVKVKEGEEKNLIKVAKPCITATRKEKGCLGYELLQDAENPRQFAFHERWKSVEALQEHFKTAHLKKLIQDVKEMLDGNLRSVVLRNTDKD
jgi:quinol monooxygenase YgiN